MVIQVIYPSLSAHIRWHADDAVHPVQGPRPLDFASYLLYEKKS